MSPANEVHIKENHITDQSFGVKSNVLSMRTSQPVGDFNCSSTSTSPSSSPDHGHGSLPDSPVDSLAPGLISNNLTGGGRVEIKLSSSKSIKCPPPLARPRISKIRIEQVSQSVTQIECNTRDHLAKKVASSDHEAHEQVAGNTNLQQQQQQLPVTSVIRASKPVDVKPDTKQITLIHCKVDPVTDLSPGGVDGEGTVSLIASSIIVTTSSKEQAVFQGKGDYGKVMITTANANQVNKPTVVTTPAISATMSTVADETSSQNAPPGAAAIHGYFANDSSAEEDINSNCTINSSSSSNQLLSPAPVQVLQLQKAQRSTACVTPAAIESPTSSTVKQPATNNNVTTGDLKKQSNCTSVPCNSHTSSENTSPYECEDDIPCWSEKSIHIQGRGTATDESLDGPLNRNYHNNHDDEYDNDNGNHHHHQQQQHLQKSTDGANVKRLHGTLNSSSHLSSTLANPLAGQKNHQQTNCYSFSPGVSTPPPIESESLTPRKSNDHHQLPHSGKDHFISSSTTTATVTVAAESVRVTKGDILPVASGKSGANYSSESNSKMSHQLPSPSTSRSKLPAPTHQLSCNNSYPDDLNPFDDEDGRGEKNEEEDEAEDEHSSSRWSHETASKQYANGSPCNSTKFNTQMSLNVNSIQLQQQQPSAVASSENVDATKDVAFHGENVNKEKSQSSNFGHTNHFIGKGDTSTTTTAPKKVPSMATPTPKPRSLRGTGSIRNTSKSPELESPPSLKSTSRDTSNHPCQDLNSNVETSSRSSTTKNVVYPGDLNPFGDEEEEETKVGTLNSTTRSNNCNSSVRLDDGKAAYGAKSQVDYDSSLNPFGDDEEEDENVRPTSHSTPANGASFIRSLTNDQSPVNPVPKPRRSLYVNSVNSDTRCQQQLSPSLIRKSTPGQPSPGRGSYRMSQRPNVPPPPAPSDVARCINGTASPNSPSNDGRRKKPPAPKPPSPSNVNTSSNVTSNASLSSSLANSTANLDANSIHSICSNSSPISTPRNSDRRFSSANVSTNNESDSPLTQNSVPPVKVPRKKRPAPEPPKAIRRNVIGSLESIETNLNEIGDRLVEISKEFDLIEEFFTNNPLNCETSAESTDAEAKIYKYLELARERCTLARKQEELGLARREHKLEEQHADLEFAIREIELIPAFKRTAEQETQSQELLNRLIEVIDQRNEVVENMTKINKRPDFDKLIEKLKKQQQNSTLVDRVLKKFLDENDMGIIETRIYRPLDGKANEGDVASNEIVTEDSEDKKKKKKKDKKDKKEKKELEKREKKEKKEHKYLTLNSKSLLEKLNISNDSSSTTTNSKMSASLSKATSKSPLKAIKKFGTLKPGKSFLKDLSHSSKEKTRPDLPDFKSSTDSSKIQSSTHSTTEEDESKSISTGDSLENHLTDPMPVRESHLI